MVNENESVFSSLPPDSYKSTARYNATGSGEHDHINKPAGYPTNPTQKLTKERQTTRNDVRFSTKKGGTEPCQPNMPKSNYTYEPVIENSHYVSPQCMQGVPVAKLIEKDAVYWEEQWLTWQDWRTEAEMHASKLHAEVQQTRQSLKQSDHQATTGGLLESLTDIIKKHSRAVNECAKQEEIIQFFESMPFHPNQILGKKYIPKCGLIKGRHPRELKKILDALQIAKKNKSISCEPHEWLRMRLAELINESSHSTRSFPLLETISTRLLIDPEYCRITKSQQNTFAGSPEKGRKRRRHSQVGDADTNENGAASVTDSQNIAHSEGSLSPSILGI